MCCRTIYHVVFLTTSHIQRWMLTSAKGPSMNAYDMVKRPDKQAKFSCLVVTKLQCIDLTVIPT